MSVEDDGKLDRLQAEHDVLKEKYVQEITNIKDAHLKRKERILAQENRKQRQSKI